MNATRGKYIIAFDTVCTGHQTSLDENNLPVLYDTRDDAVRELFADAMAGLETADQEYFDENDLHREAVLQEMTAIHLSGNTARMESYLAQHPACNYYDEFIERAEDFVLGRKAIFTGKGGVVVGV
jgi:hypothetical protein